MNEKLLFFFAVAASPLGVVIDTWDSVRYRNGFRKNLKPAIVDSDLKIIHADDKYHPLFSLNIGSACEKTENNHQFTRLAIIPEKNPKMDLETFLFRVKMMDWVSLAKIYLMLEKTRDDKKYKPEQEADLNALMEGCKKACDHLAAHNLATAQPHILFLFDEAAEGAKSSYTMPKLKEGALTVGIQGAGNFPYGMHDYDCLNIELDPKSDLLAYGDLHSYAGFSQPISNIGVREKVKHRKITLDDIDWIVRACAEFSQNVENLKTFTAQPNLQIT